MEPLVPDVARIAVLRANGLGDLVFALPALEALRAAYPRAELVLLARPWAADLLGGRPSPVDRVVPVELALDGSDPPDVLADGVAAARAALGPVDVALQLHGGGRTTNGVVAALGARVTAGSRTPDAPALDRSLPYVYLQPEVLRYLELAGLVGAAPATLAPRLAVVPADRAAAQAVLPGDGAPVAFLHPGATDVRRRWAPERFAAVGDALAGRGVRVLVNGGPAEAGVVEAVLGAMRAPAVRVSLGLDAIAGVLEASAVVISNDSGPLHLAAAVGAPTVGLYWGPNVANSPPPWRARHRPIAAFDLRCPVCGTENLRDACGHAVSFLGPVRVDEVVAAAEDLLGLAPGDAGALERALDGRAAVARAPVAA